MNSERLARMLTDAMSWDTETHRSQPGIAAPPLVCASAAKWDPVAKRPVGFLFDANQAIEVFVKALGDERVTLVLLNGAFDMLVMAVAAAAKRGLDLMPLIFAAYEAARVFDIGLAEMLHHIALGHLNHKPHSRAETYYSLEDVHEMVTGKPNAKANDRWRESYALLENIPIAKWREVAGPEAVDYPIDDACNTLEDGLAQAGLIPNVGLHSWQDTGGRAPVCVRCKAELTQGVSATCVSTYQRYNIHDLHLQAYTHWCMQLGGAWGLTADPEAVARLKYKVNKDYAEDVKPFAAAGIVRDDGSECQNVLKRMMALAHNAKDPCPACVNTTETIGRGRGNARTYETVKAPGRIPSPKTNGRTLVNCPDCDGTGLKLPNTCPRAPKGGIAKGRDELFQSGHNLLIAYALFGEDRKIRTTYIPFLEEGIAPELHLREDEFTAEGLEACLARIRAAGGRGRYPIVLKPNPLLETNRTSYRDKTQTMPRLGGVRECFEARPGFVYYSNDYGGIELATWAQICLWMVGHSDLAKALNEGTNVHGLLGSEMAGEPYADFMRKVEAGDPRAKAFRQCAKPGNFMFPGGGGIITFVQICRADMSVSTPHPTGPVVRNGVRIYPGLRFCLLIGGAERCGEKMLYEYRKKEIDPVCAKCVECASWIRESWGKRWREADPYFKAITEISKRGFQKHPISNRIRGDIGFCDGANGFFQELAAQGAKDALRHVVREQYDSSYRPIDLNGERSILYGVSRNIAFLHDELLGEARADIAPECAERIGTVMVDRMKHYVRDVKVTAEPTLMRRWYKAAQCIRDEHGRLLVWEPKKK